MTEGNKAWWRAALVGAMLVIASLEGCSASTARAPSDAAVTDLIAIDTPPLVDVPTAIDTPPAVDVPVVDVPPTCDASTTLCGVACVDTATSASHCGACGHACDPSWSCVAAACACAAGQHQVGTVCAADDAPRPLAPLSLGDVTQRRPTLRWALPPGVDGAVVELCRDRACASVIETLRVTGTSTRPTADLPARSTVFWRLRGRVGAEERSGLGPTWIFHVPARSASTAVDTSSNAHFDVNGDGFDDVVVGAREAAPSGTDRLGMASVYYGSATWTQPATGTARTPDRLFEGGPTNWSLDDNFLVANGGDINGDGYADLVLGRATAAPGGRTAAGTVSVFYGSAIWNPPASGVARTPDRLLEGAAADDRFGHAVAGAGDVNGDGYADLVVGAYTADPGGRIDAGTASVFYGSATWSQPAAGTARIPDRLFEGAETNREFGFSVAGAGDINGDGYADLAIDAFPELPNAGAFQYSTATNLFHGGATWVQPPAGTASTPDRLFRGGPHETVNTSLASAGDVNGDGYTDLAVGAGALSRGTVRVYYGSATWTQPAAGTAPAPDRLFEGARGGDDFGFSVAGAGDVNGDGYSDVVVGAEGAAPGGREHAGTASLFYGSATWTPPAAGTALIPDRLFEGAVAGDASGWSAAGAGDVNGDGYADLVVGAFHAAPGGRNDAGTASVFYGSMTWTQPAAGTARTPDRLLEGAAADYWFGLSVASAADLLTPLRAPRPLACWRSPPPLAPPTTPSPTHFIPSRRTSPLLPTSRS